MKKKDTSWETVEKWYASCVGDKGHYYHQSVILPSLLRLLKIPKKKPFSLLDLGCGEGVLSRALFPNVHYTGIDASSSLLHEAKKKSKRGTEEWICGDITKDFSLDKNDFDCAVFLLSLQNMQDPEAAIANAKKHLKRGGQLLVVLNHPCFRIPRQSSWGVDEEQSMQYRKVQKYMSSMKIPIQMHPGKKEHSETTYSFHHSLSDYFSFLAKSGFCVTALEEWCSDKMSRGGRAKMENRARKEIPLFLALLAIEKASIK